MATQRERVLAAFKARQSGIAGEVSGAQDPNRGDVNEGLDRPATGPLDENFDVTGLRVKRAGDGNVYVFTPEGERIGEVRFTDLVEHQGTPLGAKKERDAFGRARSVRSVERDAFGRSRRGRNR